MERAVPFPEDFDARLARAGERCARLPGFVAAVVYGSVARGEATPWSDVDIAVLCRDELPIEARADLMGDLAALFGRDVDVTDLRRANIPLRGHIVHDGKLIAEADPDAWTHFAARATFVWLDFKPLYESALKLEIAAMREAWAR
jgi:predicted nucleotidyltransferase